MCNDHPVPIITSPIGNEQGRDGARSVARAHIPSRPSAPGRDGTGWDGMGRDGAALTSFKEDD